MAVDLQKITLLVFDEKDNFQSKNTQDRIGRDLFRSVRLIEDRKDFEREFDNLQDDEQFVLICHVFHAEKDGSALRGVARFDSSGITHDYHINPVYVSAGDSMEVMENMKKKEGVKSTVYIYKEIRDNIRTGGVFVYSKNLLKRSETPVSGSGQVAKGYNFDYAIIAALYKDEYEQMKDLFEWLPNENVNTETKVYKAGHLKGRPDKRIVVGIQPATGMVDAAVIASQMLEMFKPKYILMTGVCGVKSSLAIGDIVVASSVFTFQKGKVSDLRDKKGKLIKLYDADRREIDLGHLYDEKGNQVSVSVEKFEPEQGASMEVHSLVKDAIEDQIENIEKTINKIIEPYRPGKVTIHFEPMACSTMVINKEGYFDDHIKPQDRKVAAVEMESYGVARAAKLTNGGHTKWIIFKSGMDNMALKDDKAKKFAARCSALFLSNLLESGALEK
ncbi:hypothetical protein ACQKLP_10790 [Chitinophaga sp. NPDC101104]|uniref:5'-methylthioadenosine/S-adenosylhomocysteine nucleosidase family protein n=1 Tax=Chitinophaga sp. NPDC101104 TaxID=3390561 RepID=UPI003D076940